MIQILRGHSQPGTIQPREICTLRFHQTDLRNLLVEVLPDEGKVLLQILLTGFQPGIAALIRSPAGSKTHLIQARGTAAPQLLPEGTAQRFARNDDVGCLQPGQVEGFTGSGTDHTAIPQYWIRFEEWGMGMCRKRKITVDFV